MIDIKINIPTNLVNELLGNVKISSEIQRFTSEIESQASQVTAAVDSVLGLNLNETINGLKSLTQNSDEFATGLEKNIGVITITPDVPGLETALTKTTTETTNLGKLTESTVTNGALNEIIASNAPRSIKTVLNNVTGVVPEFDKVISGIVPAALADVAEEAYGAIDEALNGSISTVIGNVNTAASNLGLRLEVSIGDLGLGVLDNISLGVDNYVEKTIRELVKSDTPNEVVNEVIRDLTRNKDEKTAIQKLQPYRRTTVTARNLEDTVISIPKSASTQITPFSPSTDPFGTTTGKVKEVNPSSSGWRGRNTDLNTYVFEEVNSVEELIAEFRGMTREITEFVLHWTANFNNQGHVGAREIHQVALNRTDFNFDGCCYHYIIKRDGTIERGRPVNIQGAHAGSGGHNKFSIGVSFVAGYNCNSGTRNPGRFQSAESITPAQFQAFDNWAHAFYTVWPAGQAFGHNDTDPGRKPDPGFDVPAYVEQKFSKRNIVAASQGPLSPLALSQFT